MGTLIQSLDVFHEAHVPEKLFFRHSQIARLMFAISTAQKGERPLSVVLYGPAGTGKTLGGKIMLETYKRKNLSHCLVNGFEDATFHAVLDKIIEAEKILCPDVLNADYKLNVIKQHLKNKPILVVLEELDAMPRTERDRTLYCLRDLPMCELVMITRSPYLLFSSDERFNNVLHWHFFIFMLYFLMKGAHTKWLSVKTKFMTFLFILRLVSSKRLKNCPN